MCVSAGMGRGAVGVWWRCPVNPWWRNACSPSRLETRVFFVCVDILRDAARERGLTTHTLGKRNGRRSAWGQKTKNKQGTSKKRDNQVQEAASGGTRRIPPQPSCAKGG